MDIKLLRDVFFRCFLYGIILLAFSLIVYVFMGDRVYSIQSCVFRLTRYQFNKMFFLGIMEMKILVLFLFGIPALALTVAMKSQKK